MYSCNSIISIFSIFSGFSLLITPIILFKFLRLSTKYLHNLPSQPCFPMLPCFRLLWETNWAIQSSPNTLCTYFYTFACDCALASPFLYLSRLCLFSFSSNVIFMKFNLILKTIKFFFWISVSFYLFYGTNSTFFCSYFWLISDLTLKWL